ncbi:MAG: zinc-dependent metalloprotease [Tenuifilaceae bacterium]|jgi:hypothetical protein|nr:zinc-dependent metalloprotease [Tenuifilaceae bacterium]
MIKRLALLLVVLFSLIQGYAQEEFIKVIDNGGKYKLEIPDCLLGKPLLFGSRVVDISAPSAKVYSAGQMRKPPVLIRFAQRGDLLVMEELVDFVDVDETDPIYEPLSRNARVGGVYYFNVESRGEGNEASVIDVTKFFSEQVELAWPLPDNVKMGRLDSQLSQLLFMRQFNDRINIRGYYEFLGGKSTFAITVQYFLLKLPEEPLQTRFNDDRIGYQPFTKKSYASGKPISTNKYIARWRIEPAPSDLERHRAGELVESQQPIVLYIEPYFPADWIPYIKQGVEVWNAAFEKIGFKNVMVAKEFPVNDTLFDPYDIKTNVIRYLPLDEANAAGQIWTDPRSGEIINGEVLWWNNVVELISMWRFTQTAAADPNARALNYDSDFLGEMIRYAIAHEVGHVLGIQHNLRSSYAYPIDSLRSPTFTQQYGTTASIMDYARFNHIAQPGDLQNGVSLTPPSLGPFDYLSVEYGYSFIHGANTPQDELPALDFLFKSKGDDPMYRFAPFIAVPISPDPSAQTESLGDDVIRSSSKGIQNTQVILRNLIDWTLSEGGSISDINARYEALAKQYFRYITLSISYVGGTYSVYGPIDSTLTNHISVSKEKQKEALKFVISSLKDVHLYLDNSNLAKVIGSKAEDVLKKQAEIMETLLGNFILPRVLRNSLSGSDQFSLEEYLGIIDQLLWETLNPDEPYHRNLQITYIQTLQNLARIPAEADAGKLGPKAIIAQAAYKQKVLTQKKLERMMRKDSKSRAHFTFLLELL